MTPKILIADDNKANILALESVVSSLDVVIESTTSGARALEMTLESDYALVLMDVHMPEMTGFEVVALMREREKTKQMPVIFVTAVHQDEQSMISGYDTGAVDYMYKPLIPEIVVGKVQVFLDLYNQQQKIKTLNDELMMVNKDLQDFTHIASHDLQEPLRTIGYHSSYLKHLLGKNAPEEQIEATETITETTLKMSLFIKDLLNYSKCDWHFEPEDIDLGSCLGESLIHLGAQIENLKAQIVQAKLPVVRGSSLLLTQLFQNLIGNALKFTAVGQAPIIEITQERRGEKEVFGIKDNGIGFDPQKKDIIFQPFKRLNSAKHYGGNGIGLSTCRKIVQKHGGDIWVETAPGQGTHFKFTLD